MECGKHENMIVMHAFSEGKCQECECEVITSHIPCDKVCEKCSEEKNLCQVCGELIDSE